MSLNGLDDAKIKEAYDAAVGEPGGWFLLKYASRDELELLERGNGGIVEIRNSIAQAIKPSPLFGFLKYRRRNVLIQYVPEDCSRLAKARATVHFIALCDRFSPYDTTFSISSAKELKDTQLSNACSLHTASGSTSSSTSSLRRRRLMEIAEEEEEGEREKKRRSLDEHPKTPVAAENPVTLNADLARSPEASKFSSDTNPPLFSGVPRPPSSPATSFDDNCRRMSSQSARPELYGYSSYSYGKPKVKLGPRPSVDSSGRSRTSTSGSAGSGEHRPTAAMPAGLKVTSRSGRKGSKSQQDKTPQSESEAAAFQEEAGSGRLVASLMVLEASTVESSSVRPHTSSGAFGAPSDSRPTLPASSITKFPAASVAPSCLKNHMSSDKAREKARLLRAMKLREEKRRKALENAVAAAAGAAQPGATSATEETPSSRVPPPERTRTEETSADSHHVPDTIDSIPTEEECVVVGSRDVDGAIEKEEEKEAEEDSNLPLPESKADSGTGIEAGATEQALLTTPTDSHPASPMATASEVGDSTQASSLSESTDETVQAERGEKPAAEEVEEEEEEEEGEEQEGGALAAAHVEGLSDADQKVFVDGHVPAKEEGSGPRAEHDRELPKLGPDGGRLHQPSTDDQQVIVSVRASQQAAASAGHMPDLQTKLLPISKFSTTAPPVSPRPAEGERNAAPGDGSTKAAHAETAPLASVAVDQVKNPIPQSLTSPRSGLQIPLSKFSTHQDTTPTSPTSQPLLSVCLPSPPSPATPKARSEAGTDQDESSVLPLSRTSGPPSPSMLAKPPWPRLTLAPPAILTNFAAQNKRSVHPSVASLSDDDDLMEELQSATVQQAQPIVVSKSPRNPVPKRSVTASMLDNNSTSSLPSMVRTVSNPVRGGLLPPGDVSTSSARPLSGAAYLHRITQQQSADLRPKSAAKIGSGISQRIKALEKVSSTAGGAGTHLGDSLAPKERPSSAFFPVRKASNVRESSLPSLVLERTSSLARTKTPSPARSREESPETKRPVGRDRSGSLANRLSMFEFGGLPRGQPESVQVTARIIRDPGQPYPRAPEFKADPSNYGQLELKESPLVVDVKTAGLFLDPILSVEPPAKEQQESRPGRDSSLVERRLSKGRRSQHYDSGVRELAKQETRDFAGAEASQTRRRSSLTVVKDFIKDRRDSLLGSITSPSTDNLAAVVSPTSSTLALPSANGSPTRPGSSRPPSVHQTLGHSRRLSVGSRRSSVDQQQSSLSPSAKTDLSMASEDSGANSPQTARSGGSRSRTSRFMRRLSNSLTVSRKSTTPVISPTVAEENAADLVPAASSATTLLTPSRRDTPEAAAAAAAAASARAAGPYQPPTIVAFMGDVNVQFPDNLLWKRRTMCLNNQGFLILSTNTGVVPSAMPPRPASAVEAGGRQVHAGTVKRYHMSEFRTPYPPEMELEELPNSVVLDFADGSSGLQIACEDRAGQTNVLHILVDAHSAHKLCP